MNKQDSVKRKRGSHGKGRARRRVLPGILAAAVVLAAGLSIVFFVMSKRPGTSGISASSSGQTVSSRAAVSSAAGQSRPASSLSAPVSSSAAQASSQKSGVSRALGGSNVSDIQFTLGKWGLDPDVTASDDGTGFLYDATAVDSKTGVQLRYEILTEGDFPVVSATFSAANLKAAGESDFLALCKNYLGHCATMTYDKNRPANAKSWVVSHLTAQNGEAKPVSVVIGGAKFTLSGTQKSRTLSVAKAP